jgi:hypothetical protein
MANQPKSVDATFYAVVTPEWSRWSKDSSGRPLLDGAKVERITQNRPQSIKGDALVTRLTLRIDAGALLPLQPQAVIQVSAGQAEIIEAVAVDPRSDDEASA